MYVYAVYFSCTLFLYCLTWRNKEIYNDKPTKDPEGNSAICLHLHYNGTLSCNTPAKFATFVVNLPLHPASRECCTIHAQ